MRGYRYRILGGLALAASVVVPVAGWSPAGATIVLVPPPSITHAASCSSPALRNESAALDGWLASVRSQAGAVVRLAANQCYRTDQTIVLAHKRGITFDGNGSTFASFADATTGRTNAHLTLRDDSNVVVRNVRIAGSAPGGYDATHEAQHGIYVVGGNGVTIDHVAVDGVYGDLVALQRDSRRAPPTSITIQNSQFGASSRSHRGAGRHELSIDDGVNVTVTGNYFGHASRSGVDIEPTSTGAKIRNITIEHNTFGPNPGYWFANLGAGARIKGVYLLDNQLVGRSLRVVAGSPDGVVNRSDYRFVGNVSSTIQPAGSCRNGGNPIMRIVGVASLVIQANTQPMEPPARKSCQYLLEGRHLIGATVISNFLQNAWQVASYDSTSTHVCVAGNYIGPNDPPTQLAPNQLAGCH